MAEQTFAIDIGSSNICIYQKDVGLVLKEPCLVAVTKTQEGYATKALGEDAKNLQGKTDSRTSIFSPICEGEIKSDEYAFLLVKHLLKKVYKKKSLFFKDLKLVICVPTGISNFAKEKYVSLGYDLGAKEVVAIPKVICTAIGLGINISANNAHMVVDIGGGTIDVGVINLNSIIEGSTLGLGGRGMDTAIMEVLKNRYGIEIGSLTAQKLKEEIGSLFINDHASLEVSGVNVATKTPASVVCSASDIQYAITPFMTEIIRVVETTINQLEPEISADVARNGIYLAGGLSKISGIEKYFRNHLNILVYTVDNSEDACIVGAGKLISDQEFLDKVIYEL